MTRARLTVTKVSRLKAAPAPSGCEAFSAFSNVTLKFLDLHDVEMILELVAGLKNEISVYGKSKGWKFKTYSRKNSDDGLCGQRTTSDPPGEPPRSLLILLAVSYSVCKH